MVFTALRQISKQDKGKHVSIIMKTVLTSTGLLEGLVYSKAVYYLEQPLWHLTVKKVHSYSIPCLIGYWLLCTSGSQSGICRPLSILTTSQIDMTLGGFYKLICHSIICVNDTGRFCWFCFGLKSFYHEGNSKIWNLNWLEGRILAATSQVGVTCTVQSILETFLFASPESHWISCQKALLTLIAKEEKIDH